MTAAGGAIAGSEAARGTLEAWREVRADEAIQFVPIKAKETPPETPAWLESVLDFLGRALAPVGKWLGGSWGAIEVVLLVLAALGLAWIAWAVLVPLWRNRRPRTAVREEEWQPQREAALALLEDADRLAAEGRYGEAAHLLLQRSVGHIADARPAWLSPSSTAREIGAEPALPARARTAFAVIAREVERSLFALQGLSSTDWRRAREAYADFALADLRAGGA